MFTWIDSLKKLHAVSVPGTANFRFLYPNSPLSIESKTFLQSNKFASAGLLHCKPNT